MEYEGLRLGLFLGGLVMAAVPILLGVAFAVFFVRQLRKERVHGGTAHAPEGQHEKADHGV